MNKIGHEDDYSNHDTESYCPEIRAVIGDGIVEEVVDTDCEVMEGTEIMEDYDF